MSHSETLFWLAMMMLGFLGSALYSGLETGTYSLNRVRLHLLSQQGSRPAMALRAMVRQPTALLSTLLIGNNAANQMGTSSLAVLLAAWGWGQWEAILLNVAIVTPLLFVFGETLPKDVFAVHADKLMYRLTGFLTGSRRLFTYTGFVPLIGSVSSLLMKQLGATQTFQPTHPRRQVEYLMQESVGYGLLSEGQTTIMRQVMRMAESPLEQRMHPWHDVPTVGVDEEIRSLRQRARQSDRSRYPVVDASGQVVGLVNVLDALLMPEDEPAPIHSLMTRVTKLPHAMPQRQAIRALQQQAAAMAVVVDDQDQPVGIVSVQDLLEPITGFVGTEHR